MFQFLRDMFLSSHTFLNAMLLHVWNTILNYVSAILEAAISLLPQDLQDMIDNLDFNYMFSLMDIAAYALPVYQCLTIFILATTTIGVIRVIRFAIGLIPTVDG